MTMKDKHPQSTTAVSDPVVGQTLQTDGRTRDLSFHPTASNPVTAFLTGFSTLLSPIPLTASRC